MFECTTCENFTFCKKWFKNNENHLHTFKKKKIPAKYQPPENVKSLIEKAYILCHLCKRSLLEKSNRVFKCNTCDIFIWKDCKNDHLESEGEHDVNKFKNFHHPEEDDEEARNNK